jgi:hypothetical protein
VTIRIETTPRQRRGNLQDLINEIAAEAAVKR